MVAQALIIIGASVFGILGIIHFAYTFFTNKFDARDALTTVAMKATSPILTRRTNMWDAWIGFNASHSLGIVLFAAIYLVLAGGYMSVLRQSPGWVWLAVAWSGAYLALAKALLVPNTLNRDRRRDHLLCVGRTGPHVLGKGRQSKCPTGSALIQIPAKIE